MSQVTSVRLTDKQMKSVNESCLNLSKFVRVKLDEHFEQKGVQQCRKKFGKFGMSDKGVHRKDG